MTEKMQAFADGKVAGLSHHDAVVQAGYSPRGADQTATKLMRHPDVKAAIKKGKARTISAACGSKDEDDQQGLSSKAPRMPKKRYTDSMEFLMDAMNHEQLPIAARADYAKSLLQYQHAKIGETGKKESARDKARDIARGTGGKRGKFETMQGPQLRAIDGGKA